MDKKLKKEIKYWMFTYVKQNKVSVEEKNLGL